MLCIQVSRGLLHCKVSLQQYMFAISKVYGCHNPPGKKNNLLSDKTLVKINNDIRDERGR